MTIDLDRITHPLRLAAGSHQEGSGKGCAMNVVSYINGDSKITDYPACSARPLARLVQTLNDRLAGPDGFLSPENSVIVLDLGWLTVGTAGTPRSVVWQWLADLLVDADHGVVRFARRSGTESAIRVVAALCVRASNGDHVTRDEWAVARKNANEAQADAAAYAATYADAADAAHAAYAATAAYAAAADAAAAHAYAAAYADAAHAAAARIDFTRWAITHWRNLAGLDTTEIDTTAVNTALARINA